jgi:hypothetical protein
MTLLLFASVKENEGGDERAFAISFSANQIVALTLAHAIFVVARTSFRTCALLHLRTTNTIGKAGQLVKSLWRFSPGRGETATKRIRRVFVEPRGLVEPRQAIVNVHRLVYANKTNKPVMHGTSQPRVIVTFTHLSRSSW